MKNLPGIVKVRKTSFYTQVHSHPIQQDLEDLRSIGLLAYVQSMSEDFVLRISDQACFDCTVSSICCNKWCA